MYVVANPRKDGQVSICTWSTSHILLPTPYFLPDLLPTSYILLPTSYLIYFLLPPSYSLLPTPYSLLPTWSTSYLIYFPLSSCSHACTYTWRVHVGARAAAAQCTYMSHACTYTWRVHVHTRDVCMYIHVTCTCRCSSCCCATRSECSPSSPPSSRR